LGKTDRTAVLRHRDVVSSAAYVEFIDDVVGEFTARCGAVVVVMPQRRHGDEAQLEQRHGGDSGSRPFGGAQGSSFSNPWPTVAGRPVNSTLLSGSVRVNRWRDLGTGSAIERPPMRAVLRSNSNRRYFSIARRAPL
jgi:hypothetical protein